MCSTSSFKRLAVVSMRKESQLEWQLAMLPDTSLTVPKRYVGVDGMKDFLSATETEI